MNIFFRVDSSNIIGTGHIIRCLKLASFFPKDDIYFICKKFKGNLNSKVTSNNYILFELNTPNNNICLEDTSTWLGEDYEVDANKTIDILKNHNVDILFIDNYAINYKWEKMVKKYVKNMVLIDDFVQRKHDCDYIINGIEEDKNKYSNICNADCKLLLGPEYFIINKEFFDLAPYKKFNNTIKCIFVFISGSDNDNYTFKIMKFLQNKFNSIKFNILIGKSNFNKDQIEKLCKANINYNFYYDVENVYDIMFEADLCIGSLGQNFIERMVFGIPSIVFTLADNQLEFLDKYKDKEIFLYCGHKINNFENIYLNINKLISDNILYKNLIENNKLISKKFKNNKLLNINDRL